MGWVVQLREDSEGAADAVVQGLSCGSLSL